MGAIDHPKPGFCTLLRTPQQCTLMSPSLSTSTTLPSCPALMSPRFSRVTIPWTRGEINSKWWENDSPFSKMVIFHSYTHTHTYTHTYIYNVIIVKCWFSPTKKNSDVRKIKSLKCKWMNASVHVRSALPLRSHGPPPRRALDPWEPRHRGVLPPPGGGKLEL